MVQFRNQVKYHALNSGAEDVNAQVGTQEDNPTC